MRRRVSIMTDAAITPSMFRAILRSLLSAITLLAICACSMIKMVDPDFKIPFPKLHLPSMNTIAKLVPGMPEHDKVDAQDPDVPFNSRGTLGFGHTLRIEVYEGSRGPSQIFSGIAMVDKEGLVSLGEVGSARVGGQHLPVAANSIAAAFRIAGRNTRPITVHIISVENTPVISINGDVREPEFIPAFEDMSVTHAVTITGGRKPGSTTRSVYITRHGERRFFTSLEAANDKWKPRAGDIITLSPDI